MKWALFVDVEVWIGCSSMKWVLFVDVESGVDERPVLRHGHLTHRCFSGIPANRDDWKVKTMRATKAEARLRQVCGEWVRFGIERWSSYI